MLLRGPSTTVPICAHRIHAKRRINTVLNWLRGASCGALLCPSVPTPNQNILCKMQILFGDPRRDLNPCYRRERQLKPQHQRIAENRNASDRIPPAVTHNQNAPRLSADRISLQAGQYLCPVQILRSLPVPSLSQTRALPIFCPEDAVAWALSCRSPAQGFAALRACPDRLQPLSASWEDE
jgi:hypothetical protein